MVEFLPGFGKGTLGDGSYRDLFSMKCLEEIIQFILKGAFDHIHEEEDHIVERQEPFSNEILVASAVARKKILRKDDIFKKINKIGTNFQTRVPCQLDQHFEKYLAFLPPFEIEFASVKSKVNIS